MEARIALTKATADPHISLMGQREVDSVAIAIARARHAGEVAERERCADVEPECPKPPKGVSALAYSIGFAKGIDVMRAAIRSLAPDTEGKL